MGSAVTDERRIAAGALVIRLFISPSACFSRAVGRVNWSAQISS